MQTLTKLDQLTMRHHEALRRALVEAAENGTSLSSYIQARRVASLGDFWVRLKTELLSNKRDQHKVKGMLDEWRDLAQHSAEAADHEPFSAAEAELEEVGAEEGDARPEQRGHPNEADMTLKGQHALDDDGSDDDVFVHRPRRRQRLLAREQVEEEL
jgi:hypothetical protein